MATATLGVKVDEATRTRLKALARAKERSPHWILRKALGEYLDREEEIEQQKLEDEARWERYVLTGEAVDHQQVQGWLEALAAGKRTSCPR